MPEVTETKDAVVFTPASVFSAGKNIPAFLCKKNKKYFRHRSSGRITPPFFTGLILVVTLASCAIFTPAGAEEAPPPPEFIICPDKSAAQAGAGMDEYYLARAYDKGYCGIIVNQKLALQWYTRAAKQGHMLAQYQLGEIYFTGNVAKAPESNTAAERGDAKAPESNTAAERGDGTPDYPEAKKWYLAAAKQGYGLAELRLGFLYAEAHYKGLKTDYKEAEKWFLAAAQQNAGDAQFRLGNFYHNYKNPPDLQNAVYWLTKAEEGGHRVAMFDLARMLGKGEGAPKNAEQSLFWMKKAAALDMLTAQMTLSEMYATGDGVAKDQMQSLIWTLKVANQPTAIPYWIDRAADIFFTEGKTAPEDYPQAMNFYERAASKGDPHAEARLGRMYLEGLGVKADLAKANDYLNKAAAADDAEAKELLGEKK